MLYIQFILRELKIQKDFQLEVILFANWPHAALIS